ncbi:MAG: hypothetical protein WKG07_27600 [Hymenobacter sp.]
MQEAIRKIEAHAALQRHASSYWPGGDYDNWWATAYAAHFLLEAQQAGFAVNKSVLDKTLAYLQFRLQKRETEPYQLLRRPATSTRQRTIAKKEIAYSLYVLALAGRQDAVALNYYRANRPAAGRGLASSCWPAPRPCSATSASFRGLLPTRLGGETAAAPPLDGIVLLAHPRRGPQCSNALLATDPNNPQVPAMARQLSRQLKQASWLSTQERAFALLALGKLARQNASRHRHGHAV